MSKIIKYSIIDVYYNGDEQGWADKKRKELEKLGYELNQEDSGSLFDYCDQYIKYNTTKTKKVVDPHSCTYKDDGKVFKCIICGETIGSWLAKEIKKDK